MSERGDKLMNRLSDWFGQEISGNTSKTAADIVRAQKDGVGAYSIGESLCGEEKKSIQECFFIMKEGTVSFPPNALYNRNTQRRPLRRPFLRLEVCFP